MTDCRAAVCNRSRRLCGGHYRRLLRYGGPAAGPGKGSPGRPRKKHNRPVRTSPNGCRRIRRPDGAWVLEHRQTMKELLGRPLRADDNVHHLDGENLNNSPHNLELRVRRQPQGVRAVDLVARALDILDRRAVTEVLDPSWHPAPVEWDAG